ncbi:uncharacterized protein LOC120003650 [Tripterygium wilfordii]|uniref:uncharacterized protein LOC120003650 n=1 Tax=Tripterygium wilfordii TaxID=458696 RepID=UPI0018F84C3D|nr:uncharacterized protein LOC120003650 [Tripterygium wilfordii]
MDSISNKYFSIFSRNEVKRVLFLRMLRIGVKLDGSMKAMALWIWLENLGFQGIIHKLSCQADDCVFKVSNEANIFLNSLHIEDSPILQHLMPVFLDLFRVVFYLNNILLQKNRIAREVGETFNRVCTNVFEDVLRHHGICKKEIVPVNHPKLGGSGILGSYPGNNTDQKESEKKSSSTTINPGARAWNPRENYSPEENRCLFLTFSQGYPLNEMQISCFFTMRYGACVDKVHVHMPEGKEYERPNQPVFAKVLFNTSITPRLVLSDAKQVKFMVNGRPMWCKPYDIAKRKNISTGNYRLTRLLLLFLRSKRNSL